MPRYTNVRIFRSGQLKSLRELFFIDNRPLAATIFYFPPIKMNSNLDNIVKLIIDGMKTMVYPDDKLLERIVVQKFEPGREPVFSALTPRLEQAVDADPPVIYIRINNDLSWR